MNLMNIAEAAIGTVVGVGFTIFVIWVISKIEDAIKEHRDRKYK